MSEPIQGLGDPSKIIRELEDLHREREQEYQQALQERSKLIWTEESHRDSFNSVYNTLTPEMKMTLGLPLTVDLKEMSTEELEELLVKIETIFKKVTSDLERYLTTGDIGHTDSLLLELANLGGASNVG